MPAPDPKLPARLIELARELRASVIGQDKAIEEVMSAIERFQAGLHDDQRPIGTFLLLGPSGVGKTHLAVEIARLTQPPENLIRLDCSEYLLEHEVAKLYGSPPGYQGAEIGSRLTNAINNLKDPEKGFILLIDEIEKAHSRFFDMWLQIFENGHFTDGKGNVLDFGRALIFITSNVGAGTFLGSKDLGFRPARPSKESQNFQLTEELRKTFRPEFLNRMSALVTFNVLDSEQQMRIYENMIADLNKRLGRMEICVEIDETLRNKVFKEGFSREFGARELRRSIIKIIERPLAHKIITGEIAADSYIKLGYDGNTIVPVTQGAYPLLMQGMT
jgi:ATP-dependent Clp protease ATP-binding subunit ClpC